MQGTQFHSSTIVVVSADTSAAESSTPGKESGAAGSSKRGVGTFFQRGLLRGDILLM